MPILPTGGLSIFTNLIIIVITALGRLLKPVAIRLQNLKTPRVFKKFKIWRAPKVAPHYAPALRQGFGYTITFSVSSMLFAVTSIALFGRIAEDSNFAFLLKGQDPGASRILLLPASPTTLSPVEPVFIPKPSFPLMEEMVLRDVLVEEVVGDFLSSFEIPFDSSV